MKNIKAVAAKTQTINPLHPIPLYYSIEKKTVYTTPGEGRSFVTNLINPNEPGDIEEIVNRWLRM